MYFYYLCMQSACERNGSLTILVGYTRTPEGDAALTAATREAGLSGDRILVLNVGERPGQSSPSALAHLEPVLHEAGVEYELRQQSRGLSAADELLATAQAEAVDLIVIGLRRRTPVGKFLLGSNAQRILLDAECPVMAVKA